MKYWRFRSNQARITGPESVMDTMKTLDEVGAMTPNMAITIANEVFGLNRPLIEEEWGDMPFELAKLDRQAKIEPPKEDKPDSDSGKVEEPTGATPSGEEDEEESVKIIARNRTRNHGRKVA